VKQGRFYAIEGTDASGKATQSELLVEKLVGKGYDVVAFDFPQYDKESSYFVREYLAGKYGKSDDVGPYAGSIFYALDRYEARDAIRRALSDGKIVVANRFSGSNMAHQGTKFTHPEQRRGYFIWLDNLEFEILGIPRPNFSVVLRVEADVAKKLLDQRIIDNPGTKKDIHEADEVHLKQSVEAYDDLCTLFPKDFIRVDCTRSSKLMSKQQIHDILWNIISADLPDSPSIVGSISYGSKPVPTTSSPATTTIIPKDSYTISTLALCHLRSAYPAAVVSSEPLQRYITPDIGTDNTQQYTEYTSKIISSYNVVVEKLAKLVQNNPRVKRADIDTALDNIRLMSMQHKITILINGENHQRLLAYLLSNELEELRRIGQQLFKAHKESLGYNAHSNKQLEQLGKRIESTAATQHKLRILADEMLPATHVAMEKPVQLTSHNPRNTFDIIPDVLYGNSNLSRKDIKESMNAWTYDDKQQVIDTLTRGQHSNHCALDLVTYTFDIISSVNVLTEFQASGAGVTMQDITPRYGYETPGIIEDADAIDEYDECFQLSLRLHSIILGARHEREAQYAVLAGHKARWSTVLTANDTARLKAQKPTNPEYAHVISTIADLSAQKHPSLY